MAGYHGMSDYTKTALVVLLLTSIVHIVSYGAPYWTTRHNGNAGLWTGCTDGICYERWNQWVASEYVNFSNTKIINPQGLNSQFGNASTFQIRQRAETTHQKEGLQPV